jgi:hypothetical protein
VSGSAPARAPAPAPDAAATPQRLVANALWKLSTTVLLALLSLAFVSANGDRLWRGLRRGITPA